MDPNAALANMRDGISRSLTTHYKEDAFDALEDVRDAAQALDEWLSNGGFLPDAWADGGRV